MAVSGSVSSFTSKGVRVAGTRSGTNTSLGRFNPANGQVYSHPKVVADKLAGSARVVVTNGNASGPGRNLRTSSIGMGGAGQRGLNRDF